MLHTDLAYLRDAFVQEFDAIVIATDTNDGVCRVALDVTYFYPTGGGQPHDLGSLNDVAVLDVRKDGDLVWHVVAGDAPALGSVMHGVINWERRHQLMRTHTAMHILCGVIWNEWQVPVTGGNMEPLSARMDFEFDPLPEGFASLWDRLSDATLHRPLHLCCLRLHAMQQAAQASTTGAASGQSRKACCSVSRGCSPARQQGA